MFNFKFTNTLLLRIVSLALQVLLLLNVLDILYTVYSNVNSGEDISYSNIVIWIVTNLLYQLPIGAIILIIKKVLEFDKKLSDKK
jgi:hypothetical protein